MDKHYYLYYTTAPVDYDYARTHSVGETNFIYRKKPEEANGHPVRMIFIDSGLVNAQIARYQSGLYGVWNSREFNYEKTSPLGHIVELPSPMNSTA